ncbi:hypothetical protein [Streptomyces sp. NBC_00989]|uniref:hypothetical protein n=1 Tax=Streptomyces sp. NBC_00989 TaxID=2903705 RepID=UPI00386D28CD|nr:hypothetical protein OG714_17695 [Streptomyces sp. NBC_00989]
MHPETTPRRTRPDVGMTDAEAASEARRIIADAYQPTAYRDTTPVPARGDAPPVAQPGRPPMSQGATDASVLMLAGATATTMVGGTAAVLMYVSQFADPLVCGLVFGAPTAFVLALARLMRRTGEATPDTHHHHYTGPITQENTTTHTRGIFARTHNDHRN